MDEHLSCRMSVGKPRRSGIGQFACVLLAMSVLTGCELIRMRVDPSLAGVPALKVEGNQWRLSKTPIRFGQWHTTEMKVGAEKTHVRGVSTDKSYDESQQSEQH